MKILLLGEYSSLHKNLKEGLQELGHEAIVASNGDSWKKISCDIDLGSRFPSVIGQIHRKIKPLLFLNEFKSFDVVQIMNPFIFYKCFPSKSFFRHLKKYNNKLFMLAAGDDAFFWRFGKSGLRYAPFDDFLKYDLKSELYYMQGEKAFIYNKWVADFSDGVIPILYEYELSYQGHNNLLNTIPIPINTSKIEYSENTVGEKLVVFHGLNRYGFKGTRHVEEAFSILKNKYPNDLELIIDGKMPLDEYLTLMRRANVVIDQVYSHSCGVNAIYALAMGKVVLGGAEPESLVSLGVNKSPVINIEPNAESIVVAIEHLLEKRNSFKQLGYESRQFALEVHGHVKVARKYVDTWNAVL